MLQHEKTDSTLHPGSPENHDIIQETAVLGGIRGVPAPAAAQRRRTGGKRLWMGQACAPSSQRRLNRRLCKWLLCAELMELMDGVKRFLDD